MGEAKRKKEQGIIPEDKIVERKVAGWRTTKEAYLELTIDMMDPYSGLGLLEQAKFHILVQLEKSRIKKEVKDAQEKAAVEGKNPMGKGLKQNPEIIQ